MQSIVKEEMTKSFMPMNPGIFKAYDVRGKYPGELNEEAALKIGRAAARYFKETSGALKPKVLVGRDLRTSSPALAENLIKGLTSSGADVWDIGEGTTPYFYFVLGTTRPGGAIMVTASHNPPEYNGFKFQDKNMHPVSLGYGLEKIKAYAEELTEAAIGPAGEAQKIENFSEKYLAFITEGIEIGSLKIVVDASGGAETLFISKLLSRFPQIEYTPLFFEPDGTFSKHPPNPLLPDSQAWSREELKGGNYRFAVIFDGDSDRIIFLDENGTWVRADFIFAFIAQEELKKNPGATFVITLNVSKSVREHIEKNGGQVILSPQGYPYLQELMIRHRAIAGVELSGHYHYAKTFYKDSTLLPFLQISEFLSRNPEPLSQLARSIEKYVSSEEIAFPVADKLGILKRIQDVYEKKGGQLSFLDGVTVEFPNWWFNLRAANTEEVVRLALEAENQALFEEKLSEVKAFINQA